ncbi:MAG: hypothetical protein RL682_2164 [Pseudomonadota bacterium]
MCAFIEQLQQAIQGHAFYLALYASLTLPDICGAMESQDGQDGQATRIKFIERFNAKLHVRRMIHAHR